MKHRGLMGSVAGLLSLCLILGAAPCMQVQAEETGSKNPFFTGLAKPEELDRLILLSADEETQLYAKMESYTPAVESPLVNNAPEFYYYERLEPIEQEMYDIMLMIANDPVEDNIGVMMTDLDPSSDAFYSSFIRAYNAMTYDHPELFWLYYSFEDSICYYSTAIVKNGIYIVYFKVEEDYPTFKSKTTEFNQAAKEFLADIDTNASQYEIARQVHDKLINMDSYNTPASEKNGGDLAHTAYGALVKDSSGNPHKPVCDGYSLAYVYLLQQCGIEAVYLAGIAGADEWSAGGHAWNIVKLDGYWYEVDVTWDDSWNDNYGKGDPYMDILLQDYAFHNRLEHYLFLISTAHMTSYEGDVSYFTYYFNDGSYYWFNTDAVHIRDTEADALAVLDATSRAFLQGLYSVMDLAPVADFDYVLSW